MMEKIGQVIERNDHDGLLQKNKRRDGERR
jgi:hypothetical protein